MRKNDIKKFLQKYDYGNLINFELLKSHQNKVYKVTTDKGCYVIKEYSKDAIGNSNYLNTRDEQIRISKILNDNGIDTVIPISYKKRNFILYKEHYYLVYNYMESRPKEKDEITIDNIRKLAFTQSKIHKLDIESSLGCSYKNIDMDIDNHLKKIYKIDGRLYEKLNTNKDILNNIINNCNKYIDEMNNNLCISHNDYKLLNVLWKNEEMILIDFDATGFSNPTCSLCESAFTFSNYGNYINYDYYEEYLNTYIKEYGLIKDNYYKALYVSFNGKLQWLNYMFSKNHLKKNNYIDDCISMIDELVLYYNNIDRFNNMFAVVNSNLK